MIDTYKHKGLRKKLIEELKEKGISDNLVLEALNAIPRHLFMDGAFVNFAYRDQAFPIGSEQTISQPYTVAFQSQLLEIKEREKVLEVGSGSGFQTAVLVKLGAKVFSIERHRSLHQKAKGILNKLGLNAKLFFGDGYEGLPTYAPFDKIIITAAAPIIPQALVDQLKVGGKIVIPLGDGEQQQMQRLTKKEDGSLAIEQFGNFSFVPMLENKSFSS